MVMVRAVQTNPAPDGKDRLGTTQTKTDSIWVASGLQRVSGIKNWGVQVELAVLGFETRRKLNWPNPNLPETTIPLTLVLPLSLSASDLSRSGKISIRSFEIRRILIDIRRQAHCRCFVGFVWNWLSSPEPKLTQPMLGVTRRWVLFCSIRSGR